MTNVLEFTGITTLNADPDRVIENAKGKLKSVTIIGETEDGEFYFASSQADAGDVVYHMELGKYRLMRICNGDDEI